MNLQDLSRLHWLLIGVVVGAVLSFSRLYHLTTGERITPDDDQSERRQTVTADALIAELQSASADPAKPPIARLTLHPPVNQTVYVTGSVSWPNIEGPESFRSIIASAPIPFKPANHSPTSDTYTLGDEIQTLAKSNPRIVYQSAWWSAPLAVISLWGGGSVLFIGVIWPTLINLAIGAGLALKRVTRAEKKRDAAYLASIQSSEKSEPPKPAVTATDTAALRKLTDVMQTGLASTASDSVAASQPLQPGPAAIRKLETAPLEASAAVDANKEEVDWGGEFYPVAHPHRKPTDPVDGTQEATKGAS